MGFDIHILGTSSARPTGLRQVSGSVVVCDEGVAIVDAGEGFQSRFAVQRKRMKQYAESQIKVGKIDVLCLTHGHAFVCRNDAFFVRATHFLSGRRYFFRARDVINNLFV